jgi:threonine 3-dehydrogenase
VRKPIILITGANGEIGHGLIEYLAGHPSLDIVALDLHPLDERLRSTCRASLTGDILDANLLQRLVSEYEIHVIYHLAALLSTRAEYTPDTAHQVNVEGTLNLLRLAHEQARWHGNPVLFLFPSSIAVYGLPDAAAKAAHPRVRETDFNFPTTMYGCNKLYCEHLGRYYALHYRQLAKDGAAAGLARTAASTSPAEASRQGSPTPRPAQSGTPGRSPSGVDFRALRFPGLISAVTLPTGGTSDYASEMIHAAARGEPYACFVSEQARIPFMAMPDAIRALTSLAECPADRLTRRAYNVGSFSLSAGEIRDRVLLAFPKANITFVPDPPRAAIVDSWPADVDDAPARRDWGWLPQYDADRAFNEYLFPRIAAYHLR